ncbi:MAG: TRAP transporter small permease [Alphaproteobacteria bacterium]|nr:TRAP transporter small permease [Alphaproteobacteria bacterium]MBN9497079.1 TRAP transporter small permease [Alphaproteobacteria bacterium]
MRAVLTAVDRAMEFALFAIFLAFSLVGGLQIFNRFALGLPLSWSEEFQKFGHVWMVFIAIPVAYRKGAHIGMDAILTRMPQGVQRAIALISEIMWLIMAIAIGVFTLRLMEVAKFQDSPGLGLRMDWVYAGMVLGAAYLALIAVRRIVAFFKPSLAETLA